MDDLVFDRSIRFAAYLIGGVLALIFGVEFTVSGIIDWAVQCVNNSFSTCQGNQIWSVLAPTISGAVILVLAIVLLLLAYGLRRPVKIPMPPPTASGAETSGPRP